MKTIIKTRLRENLNMIHTDKWTRLEKDVSDVIIPIIEKYKSEFGSDSYAVIDAVQQVFDSMFQKK